MNSLTAPVNTDEKDEEKRLARVSKNAGPLQDNIAGVTTSIRIFLFMIVSSIIYVQFLFSVCLSLQDLLTVSQLARAYFPNLFSVHGHVYLLRNHDRAVCF